MNRAIRINYDTKSVYYIEIDISTYDKKIESIKEELKADELILTYMPTGEILFRDSKDIDEICKRKSEIGTNAVFAGNIVEDVDFSVEYLKELLFPDIFEFSKEMK